MNTISTVLLRLVPILLAGCATSTPTPTPDKIYSSQEYKMMSYCVGISDIASNAASEKLKGTPKATVQEFYATKPQSMLNIATVDKVYNDKFSSIWDYSVSFFNECANNMARVPDSRVNMASYCMQNQMMADVTNSFKTAGAPKEKAYAYFEKFNSKTSHSIVNRVYASSLTRAEIKMEIWNSCMAMVSDIQP